jgi:3-deoxy-manno-octulosonate cytidylyltransferase (CMP-KDO synthetase)
VVIPARYASRRLPGKPILERVREATGRYLIQHVYERARRASSVDTVVVATDDRRILEAVQEFGGIARTTSKSHRSGTDRVAEVAEQMDHPIVVNVQGDEPEILPGQVDQVVALLEADAEASMATLGCPIYEEAQWRDPNAVKVVVDSAGTALYFSRSPIPHMRDVQGLPEDAPARPLHHLGIYAYRREFLLAYADLPPSTLEQAEKLEQLRALDAGHRIKVGITDQLPRGIDTPDDLDAWLNARRESNSK